MAPNDSTDGAITAEFATLSRIIIEIGELNIKQSGAIVPLSSVELLAPIHGRDILAVGKNYFEHAIEFNSSGYDSSDKIDQPTHPVIFTKRATSIIAHGEPIFPHPGFTKTLDYEGEVGVIIGKSGYQIDEKNALEHVWGYTIINDVSARERQQDHKQFYIGKSADTFCPMGPVAVPANRLPKVLRVQTHVNGQGRHNATTDDLIFSVAFLIKTLSEGQTLQVGDVIATGTPAGVGFGQKPPVWLKPSDVVEVSVTGLGTLRNQISEPTAKNQITERVAQIKDIPMSNLDKTCGGVGLTLINSKNLNYKKSGIDNGPQIIFIHGLGGTSEYYTPLIASLGLELSHSLHQLDLEGHGLSPTSSSSVISISNYAEDFYFLAKKVGLSRSIVIAHSMGCLVALKLALNHPEVVSKLVLIGPPPSPIPDAAQNGSITRVFILRSSGMSAIVDAVATAGASRRSNADNPVAIAAIRMSLLGQDPEGYAKGCTSLAGVTEALPVENVEAKVLIVTGDEDKVFPPSICQRYGQLMKGTDIHVLPKVGHWHVFEDLKGVAQAVGTFIK